jgi:ATP-dependent Clp protease ATP-binding subunit ClpA
MTSNLGAADMAAVMRPKLGFAVDAPEDGLSAKLAAVGLEAARRRFTPEFMNRIDRVVTFHPLGSRELQRILDIELQEVRERLRRATGSEGMSFTVTAGARSFLLREGTDTRYGARHLKRSIERWLVQPMSNLIATEQVQAGDRLFVESGREGLMFSKETNEMAIAAA